MENGIQAAGKHAERPVEAVAVPLRPSLSLVNSRFALARPPEPAPADWSAGLAHLLAWLRIDAAFVPAVPHRRLARVADWAMASGASARSAPIFAPWCGWSAAAFQHGAGSGLPQAQWAASYLLEQGRGVALPPRGIDLVLMSPHPATCAAEGAGGASVPRAGVLKAMIRAAKAEGRERVAIIGQACQRNPMARMLLAADRRLTREGLSLDILAIEDALPLLMRGPAPWGAIIAMPDIRSIIAALLRETSGVRGAWPMLWHDTARGGALAMITSEAAGEGAVAPALDAPTLIQALALALHHAGIAHAAARLHEGWARLRDSGVTTPARGSSAPYVSRVTDADFIALLCKGAATSTRPVPAWRAIGCADPVQSEPRPPGLQLVISNPVTPSC